MRHVTRLVFVFIVVFVVVLSYKTLWPGLEIQGHRQKRHIAKDFHARNVKHDQLNVIEPKQDIKLNVNLVNEFVKKYSLNMDATTHLSPWDTAARWVSHREIVPDDAPGLGAILKEMTTSKILYADVGHGGTQLKLTLTLEGGQRVVFKPKWYDRDFVIIGKPYDGADRHNAEVAAFHLSRLLEFRRSPLVAGRYVHLNSEILPVASQLLKNTFFKHENNTCFFGQCRYCRGPKDGVCAEGDLLEGIVSLWLPSKWTLDVSPHPWRRTYRNNKLARWETDDTYCQSVVESPPYNRGTRLLDILDATVFDYLMGNADRHHYETFKGVEDSMIVMLDSAKSFGNPYWDEKSILAPIIQCCRLRRSTWDRLLQLQRGVLSQVLRKLLSQDVLDPVLTSAHYTAMDRRLLHIVSSVEECIRKHGVENVLIA